MKLVKVKGDLKLDSLSGGRVGFVASREANLFW